MADYNAIVGEQINSEYIAENGGSQTTETIEMVTDAPGIPISGDYQGWYPWDKYSSGQTSNFADQSDESNDLNNGTISGTTSINSVQAGDFSGASDGVWSNSFTTVSQPFTVFAVVDPGFASSTSSDHAVCQLQTGSGNSLLSLEWYSSNSNWIIYAGNLVNGSSDNNAQLLTAVFDGSNSLIREDGTQTGSGDAGSREMDVIGVGSGEPDSSSRYFNGAIGEVRVYPDRPTNNTISAEESDLNEKWGLGLSL